MALNIQNLKPVRTEEEAREKGRAGGIASGKARREKATMKKMLEMCLEMKNEDGQTYRELATLGLIKGAVNGNSNNFRTILETLGEMENVNALRQQEEISKLDELLSEIKNEANNDIE